MIIIYTVAYLIIAFITYLIELPIIYFTFYKKVSFKYLNRTSLLVNLFTNIILNFIVLPINSTEFTIIISEIVIVIIEYFGYKLALKNEVDYNKYRVKIFFGILLANIITFLIGTIMDIFEMW